MKLPIVADTSGFISLVSITDSNHTFAKEASISIKEQQLPFIVPGEVFTEIVNILGKKFSHAAAIDAGKYIRSTSAFIIVETTQEVRKRAFDKFGDSSKSVSFTDCLVMAVADAYGTKYIFGHDAIFRKKGYIRFGVDDQKK